MTYYQKNREKLLKYAKEYHKRKLQGIFVPERVRVLGVRIKEEEIKPFKKRISQELRDKIEENTRINNEKIKHFNVVETRDTYLVRNIIKMKGIKI